MYMHVCIYIEREVDKSVSLQRKILLDVYIHICVYVQLSADSISITGLSRLPHSVSYYDDLGAHTYEVHSKDARNHIHM